MGASGHLILAVAVASIGSGFQHGYNTGVVNVPGDLMKFWIATCHPTLTEFNVKIIWSFVVSIYCLGGVVGGLICGVMANKLGRRNGLVYNNIFVLVGAVLEGVCKIAVNHVAPLLAGRFFMGVNSGINAGVCIMYLVEISPDNLRGAISSMYQFNIVISILISQILGLKYLLGQGNIWPVLWWLVLVPALIQSILFFICKESPRFILVNQGNETKAYEALRWFGFDEGDATTNLNKMKEQTAEMNALPPIKFSDFFTVDYLKKPFMIALVMMLAQQFSGINAVMFFSTAMFKLAGLGPDEATYCTIGVGVTNLLATILSLFLIDRAGRKTLLLASFGGMIIVTIVVMLCVLLKDKAHFLAWICTVCIYLYIVLFAIGAAIPWFLVSEMFEINARPIATSIAVALNWLANFCVGVSFEPIENVLGGYVFLMYIVCQILSFVFILFVVPETKNRPIEDVVNSFKKTGKKDKEKEKAAEKAPET